MPLRRTDRPHALWLLLLAVTLLARIVVPQGYMVDSDAQGLPIVTICGADGVWQAPAPVTADASADERRDRHGGESDDRPDDCHFAANSAKLTAPPPAAETLVLRRTERPLTRAASQTVAIATGSWLPPARGPPVPV